MRTLPCKLPKTKFRPWFWTPWQFKSLMCGNHSANSIGHFWKHLKGLPGFRYHLALHSLNDFELQKAIPCCIHADGAEMFRDDEFWVLNWSSAFSTGYDCMLTRFPVLILAERHMVDEDVPQHNLASCPGNIPFVNKT